MVETQEERWLLARLREAGGPMSPRALIDAACNAGVNTLALRAAFGSAVDRGAAEFTPAHQLMLSDG